MLLEGAHKQGMKALVALRGGRAIALAKEFQPAAITLDIRLPDISGWTVLDYLKHDARHSTHSGAHYLRAGYQSGRFYARCENLLTEGSHSQLSQRRCCRWCRIPCKCVPRTLSSSAGSEPMKKAIRDYLYAPDLELVEAHSGAEARAGPVE